jgi:hypothetical protein
MSWKEEVGFLDREKLKKAETKNKNRLVISK